ncbi:MAG: ribbon-helix-helix domain-containing protein [Treponema sp.]|nr:ribbon-helix-helix domain-containing protein [Treponema sp.]
MAVSKIAITIDSSTLTRLDRLVRERKYANRSRAVQEALDAQLERVEHRRLYAELENLNPEEERRFAEEGIGGERESWPEY